LKIAILEGEKTSFWKTDIHFVLPKDSPADVVSGSEGSASLTPEPTRYSLHPFDFTKLFLLIVIFFPPPYLLDLSIFSH
jgi:hypothetical protein